MSDQTPEKPTSVETKEKTWRQRIMFALRLSVSVALLAYLVLVTVPPGDRVKIVTLLGGSHLLWLSAAVATIALERLTSAWKWLVLLRVRESGLGLWEVMRTVFVATFFGTFLPSSIGGDAIRAVAHGRRRSDIAGSASSVVLDRAIGTLAMLMIASLALVPVLGTTITPMDAGIVWTLCIGALIVVLLLCSRRIHKRFYGLAGLDKAGPLRSRLAKVVNASYEFVEKKGVLLYAFLLSVAVQGVRIVITFFLGLSLGIEANLLDYLVFVPIITVFTYLPISISGMGVREAAFVILFAKIGVPAYACISLSLLFFVMGLIGTLPGAVIYAFSGMGKTSGTRS